MNKLLLLLVFVSFFTYFHSVLAQLGGFQPPESTQEPEIPTTFFGCTANDTLRRCILRILDKILKVIIVVAIAGAAVMIGWGGLLYISRGGEGGGGKESQEIKAKNRIIYAAVGLVIALLAWGLTVIIEQLVGRGRL